MPYVAGLPSPLLELYPLLHGRQSVSDPLLVLASLRTAYVSPSVSRSASPPLLCVATPTTCQQPCSLTRSLGGREYNMTDGHSRTNTVGHRAVRGRRMPPDVACSALRTRLTCVCVARVPVACLEEHRETERNHLPTPTPAVRFRSAKPLRAASLRVSTLADSPDLCGGILLSSSLFCLSSLYGPLPPLPRLTRNTTQAAPEAGNETHVWHYFRSGQSGRSAQTSARHLSAVASNHRQSAPLFGVFKHGRCTAWRRRPLLEIHSRSQRFPRIPDNLFF